MSDKTGIEWCDASWNPIRGCSLVSDGCKNCYAMGVAGRFSQPGLPYEGLTVKTTQGAKWTGKIMLVPDMLAQPLKWQRPRKIFVNSMSDLFHEGVPDSYIDQVFAVMALAPRHTFQVLTKRPERMRDYVIGLGKSAQRLDLAARSLGYTFEFDGKYLVSWPLPNVWLGVSVEDQESANKRIPLLLQTPTAIRWVSMEPLLGHVNLHPWVCAHGNVAKPEQKFSTWCDPIQSLDWIVVGGESGPKARPMHPDWARSLRDQCAAADVPFLFKQWGEWYGPAEPIPGGNFGNEMRSDKVRLLHAPGNPEGFFRRGDAFVRRVGKKAAGRLLDGVQHDGYPEGR